MSLLELSRSTSASRQMSRKMIRSLLSSILMVATFLSQLHNVVLLVRTITIEPTVYYQKLIIEGGYSVPGSMAQLSFNRKIILNYLLVK